jgi:guanine deaminase
MIQVFRGSLLFFTSDPLQDGDAAYQWIEDGLLWVGESGLIERVDAYEQLAGLLIEQQTEQQIQLLDYRGKILLPGFVDCHIHYPQTEMIAAYGTQLLDWLQTHTFPVESRFSDYDYGVSIAERFVTELLRNGTTTALVFGTVHPQSVEAFFSVAQQHRLRMIAGKVMMDRHAPESVLDTAESSTMNQKP